MTSTPARPALTLRASTMARAQVILRLVSLDPAAALTGGPGPIHALTGDGLPMAFVKVAGSDIDGYTLTFIRKP